MHAYKLIATRELRMSRSPDKARKTLHWDVRMCMRCGQIQITDAPKIMEWEDRKIENITAYDVHLSKRMSMLRNSILKRANGKTEFEICEG